MKKKVIIVVSIMFIAGILVIILANSNILKISEKDKEDPIVKKKQYLSTNYALLLYEKSNDYINNNLNINELEVDKSIEVSSDNLIEDDLKEYENCEGTLTIKKDASGIIVYGIKSNCKDADENDMKTEIKAYGNMKIDENNSYVINGLHKTENGYEASLSSRFYGEDESSTNKLYGIIVFDDDLNIIDIKEIEEPILGINTYIHYLENGYLIDWFRNTNKDQVISYYDKELNLVWEKDLNNDNTAFIGNFVYETSEYLYFEYYTDTNQLVKVAKTNGKILDTVTLKGKAISTIIHENDNLYTFGLYPSEIYEYDMNYNLKKTIDISDYQEVETGKCQFGYKIKITPKYIFYKSCLKSIYVLDLDGKVLNKNIETDILDTLNDVDFSLEDDGYIIGVEGYMTDGEYAGSPSIYKLIKKDFNHEIIYKKGIPTTYAYDKLKEAGLKLDNTTMSISGFVSGKYVENMTDVENGIEIIVTYE